MQYLTLYQLYQKMLAIMGPQGWWPADSKFEIILGAILVQNTNWKNV
ncbi:MAG: deoxyribonuclease I, partial [Tetragenococcus halophilus]|nr:deoxyribonuclease I [Tetragenococcus halophilus]MDN6607968.1 deoxyribonuclease I [Tetragenococcus halophilus]